MKKRIFLSILISVMASLSSCSANTGTGDATTSESIVANDILNSVITSTETEITTEVIEEIQTENVVSETSIKETISSTDKTTVATTEEITAATTVTTEESTTTTTTVVTTDETTTEAETTTEDTIMEITEKKYIALTFDDGPNTTTTNEVLDVLEQYGIKGSFFHIGNNINPESEVAVKRAYDMGCDIGNHSKSHPYMNELSVEEIEAEIEYVNDYIVKITGEEPKFFRPPYIAINNTMYDTIDLTFISGFGCNDWDDKVTAERRAKVIIRQAQDGGIILLHDAQGNSKTVEALHTIIPELQAQGYEFVTLTELFEIKGVKLSPDDGNLYTFVGQ